MSSEHQKSTPLLPGSHPLPDPLFHPLKIAETLSALLSPQASDRVLRKQPSTWVPCPDSRAVTTPPFAAVRLLGKRVISRLWLSGEADWMVFSVSGQMKTIYIQERIPHVRRSTPPVISSHGELRYRRQKKIFYYQQGIQRPCSQKTCPSLVACRNCLAGLSLLVPRRQLEASPGLGLHQEKRQQLLQGKVRQSTEGGASRLLRVNLGQSGHRSAHA